MGNLLGVSFDRGKAGGALQGLVAAGEIPPDATPSPLSVSVATLGGDSAPFYSREVAGAGAGGSRCFPQPGMLGLGAIMKHPDGISGLGVGRHSVRFQGGALVATESVWWENYSIPAVS